MPVDELIARLRNLPGDTEVQLARWTGESYRFQKEFLIELKQVVRFDDPDEGEWDYMTPEEYFVGAEQWEADDDPESPQTYAEAVQEFLEDSVKLVVFDFEDGRAAPETRDAIRKIVANHPLGLITLSEASTE